jgi:nucleoside-diphosphate-sugar epimerase
MNEPLQLVTGASGFIGSHLVQRLTVAGARVRALVRASSNVDLLRECGAELAVGDLRNRESIRQAMEGVTCVLHCGGLVSDWGTWRQFREANVDGTRHVVEAGLKRGIERLVHLSSAAVYGYPRLENIDENQSLRSRRLPYIATKIAAEQVVQQAHRDHGLPVVTLRPVMVFGPRCPTYVGEIVFHLRRGSMVLLDGGRYVAGIACVDNLVDAILLASKVEQAIGQTMNVCDDSDITWREYLDALADGIGVARVKRSMPTRLAYAASFVFEAAARAVRMKRRPWLTRMAVLELGQTQRYDISRARQVLGYQPRVSFDEAMRDTVQWAREHA